MDELIIELRLGQNIDCRFVDRRRTHGWAGVPMDGEIQLLSVTSFPCRNSATPGLALRPANIGEMHIYAGFADLICLKY